MKKSFLILVVLSVMACGSAFAQLAIGGQLGLRYYSGAEENSDFNFTLLPGLSYNLSDALAVGGQIGVDYSSNTGLSTTPGAGSLLPTKTKTTNSTFTFRIMPYLRYFALGSDRLKLFFDAQVPVSFGSTGVAVEIDGKKTSTDGPSLFNIGLQVVPGLRYSLSDSFALLATANVARFGVMYSSRSSKFGETTTVTSETTMGLGVNHSGYSFAPFMVGFQFMF